MFLLPNWLTAYASVRDPGTLVVATNKRTVLVLRANGTTYAIPCSSRTRTREIFERTVEAHENGEL